MVEQIFVQRLTDAESRTAAAEVGRQTIAELWGAAMRTALGAVSAYIC